MLLRQSPSVLQKVRRHSLSLKNQRSSQVWQVEPPEQSPLSEHPLAAAGTGTIRIAARISAIPKLRLPFAMSAPPRNKPWTNGSQQRAQWLRSQP